MNKDPAMSHQGRAFDVPAEDYTWLQLAQYAAAWAFAISLVALLVSLMTGHITDPAMRAVLASVAWMRP